MKPSTTENHLGTPFVTYCNMHQYFFILFSSFLLFLSLFVWEPSSIHFLYEMQSVDDFPLRSHVQLCWHGMDWMLSNRRPTVPTAVRGPGSVHLPIGSNWMRTGEMCVRKPLPIVADEVTMVSSRSQQNQSIDHHSSWFCIPVNPP